METIKRLVAVPDENCVALIKRKYKNEDGTWPKLEVEPLTEHTIDEAVEITAAKLAEESANLCCYVLYGKWTVIKFDTYKNGTKTEEYEPEWPHLRINQGVDKVTIKEEIEHYLSKV